MPGQRYSRSMGWGAKGRRKENAPHNVRRAIWEGRLALGWAAKGVRWKRWGKAKEKAYPGTRMRSRFLGRGGSNRYCCVKKTPAGRLANCEPSAEGRSWKTGAKRTLLRREFALQNRYPLQTRAKRQKKKTEPGTRLASRLGLVRVTGLEPAREAHQNLNLARLPIPPYPQKDG